jgi:GGDEF domain-containing protein
LHRHAFVERAHAMTAEAGRAGRVVAMCVLGLDETTSDPDELAQERQQRDKKLAAVGTLLGSRLREYDLRARWSEEEVILALPDVDALTAEPLMRRLLEAFVANGLECSAGVAIFPGDEHVMESLVRVARRRWRRAKGNGLDVVTIG